MPRAVKLPPPNLPAPCPPWEPSLTPTYWADAGRRQQQGDCRAIVHRFQAARAEHLFRRVAEYGVRKTKLAPRESEKHAREPHDFEFELQYVAVELERGKRSDRRR